MLLQTLVKVVGEHCYYSLLSTARSSSASASASTARSSVSNSAGSTINSATTTTALRIFKSSSPQKASPVSSLSWIQTVSSALLLAMPVVVMDEARMARRRLEGDPYIAAAAHWSNPWMMASVGCKRSELLQLRASSSASSAISA